MQRCTIYSAWCSDLRRYGLALMEFWCALRWQESFTLQHAPTVFAERTTCKQSLVGMYTISVSVGILCNLSSPSARCKCSKYYEPKSHSSSRFSVSFLWPNKRSSIWSNPHKARPGIYSNWIEFLKFWLCFSIETLLIEMSSEDEWNECSQSVKIQSANGSVSVSLIMSASSLLWETREKKQLQWDSV